VEIRLYIRLRQSEDRNFFIRSVASAVCDFELAESSISLSFCAVNRICTRHGACKTTVTIEITTGGFFTRAMRLCASTGLLVE
jgi:hypothetical protein